MSGYSPAKSKSNADGECIYTRCHRHKSQLLKVELFFVFGLFIGVFILLNDSIIIFRR